MSLSIDEARIERLLTVIVAAANGDYDHKVALEEHDDAFLEVELGVNYLLDELALRRRQNEAQRDDLRAQTERLAAQQAALMQALSTPVIAVWPGVLALPLVGRVDDERAALISTALLPRVTAERATHVVLDLTGVDAVAETTTPALLRVIRAIALLGARCLVCGIGPDVARQLVTLGAQDPQFRAVPRLSDALAAALAEQGAAR